ncbi:MAG: 16S rRNA (guanine(966)-N(2))-methyltransferase RsmD [Aridibacter sp.]
MNDRKNTASTKPYGQKKYYKKSSEKSYGQGGYKSRNDKYEKKDDKFSKSVGGYKPRNSKFNPKNRFGDKGKDTPTWKKDNQPLPKIVSDMQITDGKFRGKYLKSIESRKVRPTARRIREILFRVIFRRVRAGRVLDLCAGAGTIGIEAISRGALIATFVERSAKMCSFIKQNLETCGIKEGHGEVFEMEAVPFLKKMQKKRRFWDVVYYDPPYDTDYDEVLKYFENGVAIKPHGVLVIEHHSEMFFPEYIGVMKRFKVVVQGETAISFYERKS